MTFQTIDPVIEAWATLHGLALGKESFARFCYTSSERGECFQIVVRPPQSDQVLVEIFSIETLHEEDLHREWLVPVSGIADALESALQTVEEWKRGVGRPA